MIYSKSTHILTHKGWEPLDNKGDSIISDLIVYNPKNYRIEEINGGIHTQKETRHSFIKLQDKYLDTTIEDTTDFRGRVILTCRQVEPFPELENISLQEIYLLGIILTDAFYTPYGAIEIYQSAKKQEVVQKIQDTINDLGYKGSFGERERGGKHYTWRISKESATEFKEKFSLEDRSAPSLDFIHFPFWERMTLLNAMMEGDGTWNNKNENGVFYKPSLIPFFQILAMTLGYKTKTNHHRKQIYFTNSGSDGGILTSINPDAMHYQSKFQGIKIMESIDWKPILIDNEFIFFGIN